MPQVIFANNEVYHVFNRGVEKRPIFITKRDYNRAILTLDFYRFKNPLLRLAKVLVLEKNKREEFLSNLKKEGKKLIDVLAFCFMPNHFHFLLRQKADGGISKFISNFTNSYTKYFNTKGKRVGPLFQGVFKAVRMENIEQLIHVSRYIHLNPVTSYLVKETQLNDYIWSSLSEYSGLMQGGSCNKDIILSNFSSSKNYLKFILDQTDYAKKLENIKHLLLE